MSRLLCLFLGHDWDPTLHLFDPVAGDWRPFTPALWDSLCKEAKAPVTAIKCRRCGLIGGR